MEEDQSEVELQVGIRSNTDESSSLTGWHAPGSHQTHRTWGPTRPQTAATGSPPPTPAAPGAVSCPNKPATPKQNKTYGGKSRRPRGSPAACPPPPSAALSLRPFSGSPEKGAGRGGAGAGKHRDGNVKSLTNSS